MFEEGHVGEKWNKKEENAYLHLGRKRKKKKKEKRKKEKETLSHIILPRRRLFIQRHRESCTSLGPAQGCGGLSHMLCALWCANRTKVRMCRYLSEGGWWSALTYTKKEINGKAVVGHLFFWAEPTRATTHHRTTSEHPRKGHLETEKKRKNLCETVKRKKQHMFTQKKTYTRICEKSLHQSMQTSTFCHRRYFFSSASCRDC